MAKKQKSSSSSGSSSSGFGGWSKRQWSFMAIIVCGIAYILALIFSLVNVDVLNTIAKIIIGICTLIAWIIVMVLAWPKVFPSGNIYKKVLFLLCCLVVLVCAVLVPFFL